MGNDSFALEVRARAEAALKALGREASEVEQLAAAAMADVVNKLEGEVRQNAARARAQERAAIAAAADEERRRTKLVPLPVGFDKWAFFDLLAVLAIRKRTLNAWLMEELEKALAAPARGYGRAPREFAQTLGILIPRFVLQGLWDAAAAYDGGRDMTRMQEHEKTRASDVLFTLLSGAITRDVQGLKGTDAEGFRLVRQHHDSLREEAAGGYKTTEAATPKAVAAYNALFEGIPDAPRLGRHPETPKPHTPEDDRAARAQAEATAQAARERAAREAEGRRIRELVGDGPAVPVAM